jgi:uncharacterized protein YceK
MLPRKLSMIFLSLIAVMVLSSCGSLNNATSAFLNQSASDYNGFKANVKSIDDTRLKAWTDEACAMPLGAIARNATGNPNVPQAIFTACPVPGMQFIPVPGK